MLHSHSKRAAKGLAYKKTTNKRILKSSSEKSEFDRLATELAEEWCSGPDIFRQHLYFE